MAKRQNKGKKPVKKNAVTIKVPSLKKNPMVVAVGVLAALLAVSLFFNVKSGGSCNLSGLMYICPEGACDTGDIDDWSGDIGVKVSTFEANWALSPIGLYMESGKVSLVDVSNKANYFNTLCSDGEVDKACDEVEQAVEETANEICESMEKVGTPELEAFVVSYCPYGLQMQRVLTEVQEAIGNDVDIKVRYIGAVVDGEITSMHGAQEAEENHRQICIREEQGDKFWDYVSCFIKAGNSAECLEEADVDTTMLDECMSDPERGVKYAQEDFTRQGQYGVTGSPTLILNGLATSEYTFGGRTAEAVKTLLCCSMSDEASGCDQQLYTAQATTGFSATYSTGGSETSGSGSC
jgi:hypothetical protein